MMLPGRIESREGDDRKNGMKRDTTAQHPSQSISYTDLMKKKILLEGELYMKKSLKGSSISTHAPYANSLAFLYNLYVGFPSNTYYSLLYISLDLFIVSPMLLTLKSSVCICLTQRGFGECQTLRW